MGAVMIKCPRTGRHIETGIKADRSSFGAMPVFFSRSYCAFCGVSHEWFAKDAWVYEEAPNVRTRARVRTTRAGNGLRDDSRRLPVDRSPAAAARLIRQI